MAGRRKDERAGIEHVRQGFRVVPHVRLPFGDGDMACGADEIAELAIGDGRAIHAECIDAHPVDRRFFRVVPVDPIWNVPPGIQIIDEACWNLPAPGEISEMSCIMRDALPNRAMAVDLG